MPLLVYCIVNPAAAPASGVAGAGVPHLDAFGLRCFYSEIESLSSDSAALRQHALEFHAVIHDIFQHVAVIPFRFPSLMADTAELSRFLEQHAAEYEAALERLRDVVQMEVRLSSRVSAASVESGADYLRARAAAMDTLRSASRALSEAVREIVHGLGYEHSWRHRPTPEGLRCFTLVPRPAVYNVQQRLRAVPLHRAQAFVSGPWPATEFFDFLPHE